MDPSSDFKELSQTEKSDLLVLKSSNIYTSEGRVISGYVVIKDGKIVDICETLQISTEDTKILEGNWVTPGFVDLHNHGCGGGNAVEEYWLSDYSTKTSIRYGTTSTLASLIFSKEKVDLTNQLIEALKKKVGKVFPNQTIIEGIHAEGPVIRSKGALPDSETNINMDDFKEFVDSLPLLKVMTISPSLEAIVDYQRIKYLFEKDVLVALGHDNEANEEEILGALRLAFKSGKQVHLTHLFNVTKFHHRDVGLTNFGLLSHFPNQDKYKDIVEPSVEIIGDFIHAHPMVVHLALTTKRIEKVCFITDAIADHLSHAKNQLSKITMNGNNLCVTDTGVFLENTTRMAGSCVNQLEIFHNLVDVLHISIPSAIRMLSENPAKFVNLTHAGTIEIGKQANILIFNDEMNLNHVILNGNIVDLSD